MSILGFVNSFRKQYGSNNIRGLLTFADNFLTYLLNKSPRRGPLYIDWEITFVCNHRCTYCNCPSLANPSKELTTKEALKVVRELGKNKVWLLVLTGGEPLLRQDIDIIIKEAKKQGLLVGINTNGYLLKEKAKMIAEYADSITVSVESPSPRVHDKIRRMKGSFKKLSEGIEELKRIRKDKRPIINVRMDINQENYKYILPYIRKWESIVDGVIFQPIHQAISGKYKAKYGMKIEASDREKFEIFFNKMFKIHPKFDNIYYREFPTFFFGFKKLYQKYKCFSGYFYAQIDPYGNLYSCTEYTTNFGNLRKHTFPELWSGRAAEFHRKMVKTKKNMCQCWYYCTGPLNCALSKITRFKSKNQ